MIMIGPNQPEDVVPESAFPNESTPPLLDGRDLFGFIKYQRLAFSIIEKHCIRAGKIRLRKHVAINLMEFAERREYVVIRVEVHDVDPYTWIIDGQETVHITSQAEVEAVMAVELTLSRILAQVIRGIRTWMLDSDPDAQWRVPTRESVSLRSVELAER